MAYKPGCYLQICDICGLQGYSTEMVKTWNNLIVHRSTCFDGPRDPLDFPPPTRPDRQTVPDARPGETDAFMPPAYVILTASDEYMITEDSLATTFFIIQES